jgi:transposase
MDTSEPVKRIRVRAYAPEFKERVLAERAEPSASIAKVASAHGVNPKMLHTWGRQARGGDSCSPAGPEFVRLPLEAVAVRPPLAPIRIDVRHGATSIAIVWPAEGRAWLREPLR